LKSIYPPRCVGIRRYEMKPSYRWERGIIKKLFPARLGDGLLVEIFGDKEYGLSCLVNKRDYAFKVGDAVDCFFDFGNITEVIPVKKGQKRIKEVL
jgi:hypothetical protein